MHKSALLPVADARAPERHDFFDDLSAFPDRYGMKLVGDCLEPILHDGEIVLIDKTEPLRVGDLALIYRRREIVPAGRFQGVLKRIVMAPPPWVKWPYREHPESEVKALIVVEMLNPRRQFAYRCEDLLGVHRCLGRMPAAVRTYPAALEECGKEARHG